jgi:hypothetical protein
MKPEDIAPQKVDKPGFDNRLSIREIDERSNAQIIADEQNSINFALVLDENGKEKRKHPSYRDPEPPHKMIWVEKTYRKIEVPHDEVVFYTHGVIMDRRTSHSDTIMIGNNRIGHVFDRTYTWNKRIYHRCAWIPNKVERAGIMYCKKISRTTRRPVAVLKKYGGTEEPQYRIVGGQEADYRDLKRVFERAFINRRIGTEDDELDKFQYEAISPIEAELVG